MTETMQTDWSSWFTTQLQASADGFVWAFEQIDLELRESLPPAPDYLGTWPPARHVWHVTEYERVLVIPSMRQWLGGAKPNGQDWHDDDDTWMSLENRSFDVLVSEFRQVRQQQLNLLAEFSLKDWEARQSTLWGQKPLSMVVTKTFQHTYEHGDTLLRMGLWWTHILAEQAKGNESS